MAINWILKGLITLYWKSKKWKRSENYRDVKEIIDHYISLVRLNCISYIYLEDRLFHFNRMEFNLQDICFINFDPLYYSKITIFSIKFKIGVLRKRVGTWYFLNLNYNFKYNSNFISKHVLHSLIFFSYISKIELWYFWDDEQTFVYVNFCIVD